MSGTEVAIRRHAAAIPAKLQYAHELANSGLLPGSYRRQPANVLWAIEYAEMLRLPPMAAMTGVHVIDGKPTASAALISALVRKAGHKLRIGYDEATMTGWAEIVRSDDPDYTFRSEWNLQRAVTAELCIVKDGKPFAVDKNGKSLPWRKFFPSMTKARATTEVARDACEEVLFGLHYTPEELGAEVDEDGIPVAQVVDEGAQSQAAGLSPDDPWYVRPSPEQEWLAKAIEAVSQRDLNGCKEDWQTSVKHVHDEKLTKGEAGRLQDLLRVRIAELKPPAEAPAAEAEAAGEDAEVVEGVVVDLDPEDPWAPKVEEIASENDAAIVLAEMNDMLAKGQMDNARYEQVGAAIESRLASLLPKAA